MVVMVGQMIALLVATAYLRRCVYFKGRLLVSVGENRCYRGSFGVGLVKGRVGDHAGAAVLYLEDASATLRLRIKPR